MKEMGVVMEPNRRSSKQDREVFEKFYAFPYCGSKRDFEENSKPKKKKDPYENLPHAIKTLLDLQDEWKMDISLSNWSSVAAISSSDVTPEMGEH